MRDEEGTPGQRGTGQVSWNWEGYGNETMSHLHVFANPVEQRQGLGRVWIKEVRGRTAVAEQCRGRSDSP